MVFHFGTGWVRWLPIAIWAPTGEELATLSDANVFDQRYVGTEPNVFAVGAADHIGEQTLTITCDTGTITVYTPQVNNVNNNMRLYVAQDGSTYHSRADHDYSLWSDPPDLGPTEALIPAHLAQAAPGYQADCYNNATIVYSDWTCSGNDQRTRTQSVEGGDYDSATGACITDTSQQEAETETCDTGNMCVSGACIPEPTFVNGLIGHWKFDGNGVNEVTGSSDAVVIGNATFNASGGKLGGYAYVPSGSDWLKIPYQSWFDLPDNFTIEFWFRQRAEQSFAQNLVYKGTGSNTYNFKIFRQLWNQYNYGPIITGFTASTTGYWTQTSNPNQLAHGEWHHVAYTKSQNGAAYYLDGALVHEINDYTGSAKVPAVDIIVGDSAVDTDFDNLRIYNRLLNQAEIRENGGFPPLDPCEIDSQAEGCVSEEPVVLETGSSTSSSTTSVPLTTGSSTTTTTPTTTTPTTTTSTTTTPTTTTPTPISTSNNVPLTTGSNIPNSTTNVPINFNESISYPSAPILYTGTFATPPFAPPTIPANCGKNNCQGLYEKYGNEVAINLEALITEDLIDEITAQVREEVMQDVVRYVELSVVKNMMKHFNTLGERGDEMLANNNRIFGEIKSVNLEEGLYSYSSEIQALKELKAEFERGIAGDETLSEEIANEWNKVSQTLQGNPEEGKIVLNQSIEKLRQLRERAEQEKFENGFAYKDVAYIFDEGYDPENEPQKYWFSESVITLTQDQLVSGYKDASGKSTYEFGPGNPLLRAEVLKVALKLFSYNVKEVDGGANWFQPYTEKARELDLSLAKENALEKVSRGEMMNLVYELGLKSGDIAPQTTFKNYLDSKESDHYWRGFQALYEIGVVHGQAEQYADLDGFLNRAEMAKIMHSMKNRLKESMETASIVQRRQSEGDASNQLWLQKVKAFLTVEWAFDK